MLANLQQFDETLKTAVLELKERVCHCEDKMSKSWNTESPLSGQDLQELKERVCHCEDKMSKSWNTESPLSGQELQELKERVCRCEATMSKSWNTEASLSVQDLQEEPPSTVKDLEKEPSLSMQARHEEPSPSEQELNDLQLKAETGATPGYGGERSANREVVSETFEHKWLTKTQYHYQFQESVWDLTIFIFMPQVPILASVWMGMLFFITLVAQLMLCGLINDFFTVRDISHDTVEDLVRWRMYSGHAWQWADDYSFQGLAHRVCTFDGSLPMSSGIANVLHKISEYMPSEEEYQHVQPYFKRLLPYTKDIGIALSMLAIWVWCLMIGQDLEQIESLTRALLPLRLGSTRVVKLSDGSYEWITTSCTRKLCCIAIILIKSLVAVCLGVCGTLYLCFTVELHDLLLNAAALQIVLDLDEMVFAALAPQTQMQMLRSMKPLKRAPSISVEGVGMRPFLVLIVTIITLISACQTVLLPQAAILQEARIAICGGNVDFISVRDSTGLFHAADVSHSQDDLRSEESRQQYFNLAISQLIWQQTDFYASLKTNYSAKTDSIVGGHFSLAGIARWDVEFGSEVRNRRCKDLIPAGGLGDRFMAKNVEVFRKILEEVVGEDILNCNHVKKLCNSKGLVGIRARQFCPTACGCSSLGSALVVFGVDNGCSPTCVQMSLIERITNRCSDEVVNGTLLLNYIEGLSQYANTIVAEWRPDVELIIAKIKLQGCGIVMNPNISGAMRYPWDDLCEVSSTWFLKSLAFACPEACACSRRKLPLCPASCELTRGINTGAGNIHIGDGDDNKDDDDGDGGFQTPPPTISSPDQSPRGRTTIVHEPHSDGDGDGDGEGGNSNGNGDRIGYGDADGDNGD